MFNNGGGRALKSTLREQVHPGVSDPKVISSMSEINSEPALRISDKSTSVPYPVPAEGPDPRSGSVKPMAWNYGPRTYDNGPSSDLVIR